MDTGADLQSALREAVNADAQSQAFENIKRVALLGLGVGATARAGVGLAGMLRRNLVGAKDPRSGSPVVPFPYPIRPSEDPEKRQRKLAAEAKAAGVLEYFQDLASGSKARTSSGVPWEMGGSVLAGVGSLTGGWMAVDKMLNARRKKEREQELNSSRTDFHDALMSMYARPYGASRPKVAELVEGLNGLYDRLVGFEKAADGEGGGPFSEGLGRLANVYGGYAALSGLVAGGLIYDHARKGQRRRLLEDRKSVV